MQLVFCEMQFKFNNSETYEINIEYDGPEHQENMTNDNEYAVQYLIGLINNGFISLANSVSTIARIDEYGETVIYKNLIDGTGTDGSLDGNNTDYLQSNLMFTKTIAEWTTGETKLLLELYEENLSLVGPMKKYKTKKAMWTEIADAINKKFGTNYTITQVENRYKTILKRKKEALDNNNKSGSSHVAIPYEDELKKIASIDDSIQPEVMGTASEIKILKKDESKVVSDGNARPSKKVGMQDRDEGPKKAAENIDKENVVNRAKKIKTMQETLLEIHHMREEAREKRHKEKMECLKLLISERNNASK